MSTPRRFAFVIPRFGESIAGGIESLVGGLASRLHARGDTVEVFTTCAWDNRTWSNHFPAGDAMEFGVLVHRYPVDSRNLDRWVHHQIRLSEGVPLSVDDQLEWMKEGVNSTALYGELMERADFFDAIFFAPYLFALTFWGSLVRPDKSFLIPCLHDEAYAYLDVIGSMFRQVRGAVFNADPERDLARRLWGSIPGGTVGLGFVPHEPEYVETLEPYFKETFPYLLYLGRKETGKNAHLLIDHFLWSKENVPGFESVKLVVAGAGSFSDLLRPQAASRPDIIDLSHVSEREKHRLLKHAGALVQPSCCESFSIVLMEAWLVGTPVVVHSGCAVTKHHVVESGGGLYFSTAEEFAMVTGELLRNRELRTMLAESGFRYTKEQYSWHAVLDRFDSVMAGLLAPGEAISASKLG